MDTPSAIALAVVVAAVLVLLLAAVARGRRTARRGGWPDREAWRRWRGCTRKRAYDYKAQVQAVLARHARQGDSTMHAYRCDFCGKWHAGHPGVQRRR